MYPELAVVPRQHAGMPDHNNNNNIGGGVADAHIDPALFQLEQGGGGGGGGGNEFGSSHGPQMPQHHDGQGQQGLEGWDQAFGNSFESYA